MNYTEKAYIELISACINDSNVQIDYNKVEYKELVRLCTIHKTAGIVFIGMKKTDNAPAKMLETFEQGFCIEVWKYSKRMAAWNAIKSELDKNKIKHIIIKGQSIAELYPVEEIRTMSDIDVLVDKEAFENVHNIMKQLGAEYNYEGSNNETNVYRFADTNIEIHSGIAFGENLSGKYDYHQYFQSVMKNVKVRNGYTYELEPQQNMIYVIYHAAKHFYNNGCGIRMITDIAVMINAYREVINWRILHKELYKVGLTEFADRIFAICKHWFGIETPGRQCDVMKLDIVEEYIISGGVFGYKNLDSDIGRLRKNKSSSYFVSAVRWVFPSYKVMKQHSDWFKDKSAILLPAAYVERIIRNAKERGGMVNWIKAIISGKKKSNVHDDILEIMGLK